MVDPFPLPPPTLLPQAPTGPPYPPFPGPRTNAIGVLQIGVSQIGDIPEFQWLTTVASQYANSTGLMGYVERFFNADDQTKNMSDLYDKLWNIATAQGYGLDVWGRIVGINRTLQIIDSQWFGFQEQMDLSWNTNVTVSLGPTLGFGEACCPFSWKPFGQGVWGLNYIWAVSTRNQGGGAFFGGSGLTHAYRLSDQSYRFLIMAKAAQNITDCAIPSINQILLNLFKERGNAYVTDGFLPSQLYFGFQESHNALPFNQGVFYNGELIPTGMIMTYTFNFPLSAADFAIVHQSGVLPKPTGVLATVVTNPFQVGFTPPPLSQLNFSASIGVQMHLQHRPPELSTNQPGYTK